MIHCIVAVEKNQGIGFNGQMPWPRLPGDMQWFKDSTTDNIIVMGATTWKSLGKKLPNRLNVVISSKLHVAADLTYSDPVDAIKSLPERYSKKDIYIIGGQKLYDSVKELVDVFYVTEIDANYECDTFFNLKFVQETCEEVNELLHFDSTETTPAYTIREYKK